MFKMFTCTLLAVVCFLSVNLGEVFAAAQKDKALVVVSFGTTFKETRELDIEALEKALASAFPDRDFYRAFTSKIVMKRLQENDGIKVDDLDTVLKKLQKEGYKDILIQPTHLTPGEEIAKKVMPAVNANKNNFAKVSLGKPLLTDKNDFVLVARALKTTFSHLAKDEIVVFMGHGSPNQHNPAYYALEESFKTLAIPAIVGVVEETDHPNYDDMLAQLKSSKAKKVLLMPLMLVAGDHANNDMAGKDDDSWANMLKKEGFIVRSDIKGIGRSIAIQKIYVVHALAALAD